MTTATEPNQLAVIVQQSGLDINKATTLMEVLSPLVAEAGELVRKAETIRVTDATQVSEMKAARATRLALKDVRVNVEKARKELKADALATGRAIDSVGNWIKAKIEPEEARLEECEKFAERAEAARKAGLKTAREALLAPFGIDTTFYQLGEMPEATFATLLDSTRVAHEAKIAAAAQAEADRIAAEEARKAEDARVRAENERLRQEAAAAEKAAQVERDRVAAERKAEEAKAAAERKAIEDKAAAERAAHELVLRKEREAREQLERDAAAAKKKEADRVAAEAAAAKKAAAAPDRAKLGFFADSIEAIPLPTIKNETLNPVLREFDDRRAAFVAWMREQIDSI